MTSSLFFLNLSPHLPQNCKTLKLLMFLIFKAGNTTVFNEQRVHTGALIKHIDHHDFLHVQEVQVGIDDVY